MNIKEIEYFLQVCKDKSINKAAKNLFISSQGLGRIIQRLEEELKAPLLLRTQFGVELTEEGKVLRAHSQKIIDQMNSLQSEINKASLSKNTLKVSISVGILSCFGIDVFTKFQNMYPLLKTEFIEISDNGVTDALVCGESDIGLGFLPVKSQELNEEILEDFKINLVVSKNHILAKNDKISLKDLANEKWILPGKQHNLSLYMHEKCKEFSFSPDVIFHTNQLFSEVIKQNCISVCYKNEIESLPKNVVAIDFLEDLSITAALILRKNQGVGSDVKLFIKYFRNLFDAKNLNKIKINSENICKCKLDRI